MEAGITDTTTLVAAVLHDTIDDTKTTYDELLARFGQEVADVVAEVTDDKSLPKAERKRLQVLHAPDRSPRAKMLKLADKTSNLQAIAASPPADWSPERLRDYVEWARSVAAGLRGVNPWLEVRFDAAANAAEATCR